MKRSFASCLTAAVLAMGFFVIPSLAKADPAKPYRFDIRDIAKGMCNGFLAIPADSVDSYDGCRSAYDRCVSTLSDLAVATADYKKFYREAPYVYVTTVPEYLVFTEEFRSSHLSIKMVRFDDYSGAEVPMMASFELAYLELKSDVGSVCKLTPIFPMDLCGNGVKDAGETCDDGADNGKPGKCPDNCKIEIKNFLRSNLPLPRYDYLLPVK